jgi:hypothetical protein
MPVHKISVKVNGRTVTGFRWGGHGKVYTGSNAEAKAAAQGRAAYANGYQGKTK